jgi:hypothetical protein
MNPENHENSEITVHQLTIEPKPIKHRELYIPSKTPFYSFPLLHPYYPPPLPPVKKNSKYANVKSKVNSNYKPTDQKYKP